MINTGIVRKLDNLGRIVIPIELRKSLNIRTGDDFNISVDGNKIVLEKFSLLDSFKNRIINIIDCFSKEMDYEIYFIVGDRIINLNDDIINHNISNFIDERKILSFLNTNFNLCDNLCLKDNVVLNPIVLNSEIIGTIIINSDDTVDRIINISKIISNIIKSNFIV